MWANARVSNLWWIFCPTVRIVSLDTTLHCAKLSKQTGFASVSLYTNSSMECPDSVQPKWSRMEGSSATRRSRWTDATQFAIRRRCRCRMHWQNDAFGRQRHRRCERRWPKVVATIRRMMGWHTARAAILIDAAVTVVTGVELRWVFRDGCRCWNRSGWKVGIRRMC